MSNWIATRRKQANLSQEGLAKELQLRGHDISRGTISHWELSISKPPLEDAEFANSLADVFNISVLTLLSEAGYKFTYAFSDNARKAAELIEKMPQTRQDTALGILEQLAAEK